MKLTGNYMTAITKFADGIKTIVVFGVRTRNELLGALRAAHEGEPFKLYDFSREKFSLEVAANDSLDPGYLADRLDIGPVDEVL